MNPRKIITERDRGFAIERAVDLMAAGWRIAAGPTRCRSGLRMKRSARRRTYWRMELVR